MTNLFSIFDPSTSPSFSLNWLSIFILLFLLPYQFWLMPSRFTFLWTLMTNYIFNEFKILISYSFSNIIIFISLISFIFFNNFLGLFPYIFTASSHMSFCLSMSLSLWLSLMLYSIINYLNNLLIHLTPSGTPFMLMPFMVIIESISLIIRPLTLSIRLTANMIAGHLLLTLLGSSGLNISNSLMLPILIFTQILLYILEISVSMIQAYVFSILSTLYSSET
uniref:ATP synthase subunit a n=1 Tax=Atta sexdens rubropilosa TaxID=64786 RepID=A0A2H4PTR0_9HYME|nr:ATP synthase F0 subunit 6 [Atta sexdens rubropilosa]AWN56121.1 ATP synthase F0 subunit 6 [Atta sexdens rubropilosa]